MMRVIGPVVDDVHVLLSLNLNATDESLLHKHYAPTVTISRHILHTINNV